MIEQVSISKIKPYPNNPRVNDKAVDPVLASIKRFKFRGAIQVDENYVIINGHTRYKAAQKLGMKTVPVEVISDLTDDEIRAYRLADNKTGEFADWDMDKLLVELSELDNMDEFGFDINEEESKFFTIDDFVFDGVEKPAWMVIRVNLEDYDDMVDEINPIIEKYNARMETSNEESD